MLAVERMGGGEGDGGGCGRECEDSVETIALFSERCEQEGQGRPLGNTLVSSRAVNDEKQYPRRRKIIRTF